MTKDELEAIRKRDAECLTYSDGSIHSGEGGDLVAEDRRALLAEVARLERALGKLYRMGARGITEYPENFPIGKVKQIAEEALGDRLDEQKHPVPQERRGCSE
jgi:hypothetical protein